MTNETQQVSFPWRFAGFVAFILYVGTILITKDSLPQALGDTDDALRLVQLRAFLEHGNWYDFRLERLSPPEGYLSHWSRLPDVIMAAIYSFALLFGSAETASWSVRLFYPGLWIVPSFLAMNYFMFKIVKQRLVVAVSLFALIACITTIMQFVAGRIDHHNSQISLSVVIVVATAFITEGKRYGVLAGCAAALLLAIGLEALPFVVLSAVLIGLRYLTLNAELPNTRAYLLALGCGTLVALLATLPPSQWNETVCDALAANYALPIVAGCLFLWGWTGLEQLNASLLLRACGIALAGILAAGLFVYLDPSCIQGPFAAVNADAKSIWLSRVNEMQPVIRVGNLEKSIPNMIFGVSILPGLCAIFWLLKNPKHQKSFAIWTMVFSFVLSAVLGMMALRTATYVGWFATPLICIAGFELVKSYGKKALYAYVPAVVAFMPVAFPFWLQPALSAALLPPAQQTDRVKEDSCTDTKNFADLAKLPKGHVMAEVDLGPYILALTPHSVVAAPYHRIGTSIVKSIKFFDGTTLSDAKSAAQQNGYTYVVLCDKETKTGLSADGGNLRQAVFDGREIDWLEPVATEPGNPLKIYSVKVP